MNQRAWYQDGGVVLLIVIVAIFGWLFYQQEKENQAPVVYPQMVGRVEQPFFGPPSLIITAWHQHTGVLRNGRLRFDIKGTQVAGPGGEDSAEFSFESWEPNQDHAVTLKFRLSQVDEASEIAITYSLMASEVKAMTGKDAWINGHWKSNPPTPP